MPIKHSNIKNSGHHKDMISINKNRLPHKKNIQKIAGCLSTKDAEELKNIIEQGCERIDPDAWKNLH
jgi:RNA binding exosome subunit